MSENPLQSLFQTFEKVSISVQTHLSNLIGQPHHPSPTTKNPLFTLSSPSKLNPTSTDSAAHLQPQHILMKVPICFRFLYANSFALYLNLYTKVSCLWFNYLFFCATELKFSHCLTKVRTE